MNVRKWPYYAPNPLRGGAPKGARSGRFCPAFAGHADAWIFNFGLNGAELIAQTRRRVEEKWVIPTCGLMR